MWHVLIADCAWLVDLPDGVRQVVAGWKEQTRAAA
jgi:hypothetical protein